MSTVCEAILCLAVFGVVGYSYFSIRKWSKLADKANAMLEQMRDELEREE